MIGLGLRLALAGGRPAVARLLLIAVAVALGTGMLLTTLAGINGVNAQNARYGWLNAGRLAATGPASPDPLWWRLRGDYVHGHTIGRADVAATGPGSPVPPGIPRLPRPGEYYVSPALAAELATTPADQLADRFPGRAVGTIGRAALPSPDTLLVIIGRTPAELSHEPDARRVAGFPSTAPSNCRTCAIGIPAAGLDLILSVVALGLLFPLLMFIGTATRLAAARREQRFAAMRLVGATPRQVSAVSAVEAAVWAVAGTALGFGVFAVLRGYVLAFPFTGARFYLADLSLRGWQVALVTIGVPLGAAASALLALRRVRVSPLGVSRRVTPRPPRAYRLVVVALGVAELAWFAVHRPQTSTAQVEAYLPGFLIIMTGLVVAGPWLTMLGARLLARRTRRPAALIAARRMADNPQAAFRAVSGLVLALFITSAAVGIIGTVAARNASPGPATGRNLYDLFQPLAPASTTAPAGLAGTPGVHGVAVVRDTPKDLPVPGADTPMVSSPSLLAACADLAGTPSFGHCAPGAQVAWVYPDLSPPTAPDGTVRPWPTAPVPAADLSRLRVVSVVAGTDGTPAAIERARTRLEAAFPQARYPFTAAEWRADNARVYNQWRRLADVVIVASLVIAGCSLAVSVAGGLVERKRAFALLRLAGVPLAMLRRVVTLESAVPLLGAAVLAVGGGLAAAHLFLLAQMGRSLTPPGTGYYVIVLGGLLVSLAVIAGTLPLLRRITGPETARNE